MQDFNGTMERNFRKESRQANRVGFWAFVALQVEPETRASGKKRGGDS
jgi:hypothetical protein